MEPFTILALMLLAGALVYFWPQILRILTTQVVPRLRSLLGEEVAALVTEVLIFLDKGMCRAREVLVRGWSALRSFVRIRTTVKRTSATTAETVTESYVRSPEGRVVKETIVEQVGWYDLPPDVRDQMMREQKTTAQYDAMEIVEQKMREQCQKQSMPDLTMVQ